MSEPTANEVQEFGDFLAEQFGGTKDAEPEESVEADSGAEPAAESVPDGSAPEEAEAEEDVPAEEPSAESAEADASDDTPADSPEPEVDWEKRYKDLQSYTDRQIAETQQSVEQQVAEQVQAQLQQMQAQQQQQAQMQPVDMNVLSEQVKNDPATTFQLAVQQRPDLLPNVIGMIAEHHGMAEAEQARAAVQHMERMQMEQMYQQQFEALEQQRLAEQAPQMLQQGIDDIVNDISNRPEYKEVFNDLEQPAAEMLQAEWRAYTESMGNPPPPDQWHGLVEKSFLRAWQQQTAANATKTDAAPPAPHVETGGANTVAEPSKAEALADEIVGHYRNGIY